MLGLLISVSVVTIAGRCWVTDVMGFGMVEDAWEMLSWRVSV